MKSENQIIVRCKQPIKIEKPLECLLTFSHRAGERNILHFVVIFSVFIFSMPFKVIIIVIEFMFLGINIFWALLRAHFNPRITGRARMSPSRAQNIFMSTNMSSIILLSSVVVKFFRGSIKVIVISVVSTTLVYQCLCKYAELLWS